MQSSSLHLFLRSGFVGAWTKIKPAQVFPPLTSLSLFNLIVTFHFFPLEKLDITS